MADRTSHNQGGRSDGIPGGRWRRVIAASTWPPG
jgi:hypothetical protein